MEWLAHLFFSGGRQKVFEEAQIKGKSSLDGVTAEMLSVLPTEQIACLAEGVELAVSLLEFEDASFMVMASLIPRKPHPTGVNKFRPICCLTILRTLLVPLAAHTAANLLDNSTNSFHTPQTGRTSHIHD